MELNKSPRHEKKGLADGSLVDDDETIVRVVRKHPFGLFLIYLETFAVLGALLLFLVIMKPVDFGNTPGQTKTIVILGVLVAVVVSFLVMIIATYVFRESRILITSKHVVQVLQSGLFARKVSRLSMANVEDVTAEQKGFFATIFRYGTLFVETAGEQKNFQFSYCPHPNSMAEEILDAREAFINDINNSFAVSQSVLDGSAPKPNLQKNQIPNQSEKV